MTSESVLITSVIGQDGTYLAELLLESGYSVDGIEKRSSSSITPRIDLLYQDHHLANPSFILHYGNFSDSMSISKIIKGVIPDEIYNLGAMSHLYVGFDSREYCGPATSDILIGNPVKAFEKLG